jgi:hypothetical protein
LGGFLTGPFLADQKYLAEGEALFGKAAWKPAFLISFCVCLTLVDCLLESAAKSSVIASLLLPVRVGRQISVQQPDQRKGSMTQRLPRSSRTRFLGPA